MAQKRSRLSDCIAQLYAWRQLQGGHGGQDKTGGATLTGEYPTLDHFAALGFDVVTCPWRNIKGVESQCQFARERRLFGVLETVWHHFRSSEFAQMSVVAANGTWDGGKVAEHGVWTSPFAVHWRQIGWDMGIKNYSGSSWGQTL